MLKCEDVQSQLQAFLDSEIDESQAGKISDHLKDCRSCSEALRRFIHLVIPERLQLVLNIFAFQHFDSLLDLRRTQQPVRARRILIHVFR